MNSLRSFFIPLAKKSVRIADKHVEANKVPDPYAILERIGPVAYSLQLPIDSKIYDVFHVSLLRPFISSIDPEKKALYELKLVSQEALNKHEFTAPPPPAKEEPKVEEVVEKQAAEAKQPILFLYGLQDAMVPPSHMEMLYAKVAAHKQHCTFVDFPTGMHMDTWLAAGDRYWRTVQEFVPSVEGGYTWIEHKSRKIGPVDEQVVGWYLRDFPHLHLEDKVLLIRGRVDTGPVALQSSNEATSPSPQREAHDRSTLSPDTQNLLPLKSPKPTRKISKPSKYKDYVSY